MDTENKRGKLFGIVNVIDLLFILAVLAVIVAGVLYFTSGGFKSGDKVTVYYTVEVEGAKEGFSQNIKEGIDVKDTIKGYYLGTIEKVETVPSVTWSFNKLTKEYFEYNPPNEEVVHITVKSSGYESDSKIISEDNEVRVGNTMYLEIKGLVVSGYIIDLKTEPAEGK